MNTEEFYTDYINNPVLSERMDFIDSAVSSKDDLYSLGVFSIVEGAILYSSFAFLKHFQAEGKNKLVNVNAGINSSVQDELLHSQAGAYIYKLYKKELLEDGGVEAEARVKDVEQKMIEAAYVIRDHEHKIVDMVFEKGKMDGITDLQMKNFIDHRIDECLAALGLEKIFKPVYNPIAKWFYKTVNGGHMHDFFAFTGSEYNRNWNEIEFGEVWRTKPSEQKENEKNVA